MSVLSLNNVTYHYDGTKRNVLTQISASFEAGKVHALVGKSGSGKTTLLSLIAGLDTAKSGEVRYNSKDLKVIDRDNYRAKDIGVIFQSYNLLTNATAVENIVLSMHISESDEQEKTRFAYELLRKVGINQDTANRKILKLSGGEQQRVGIARALSHQPGIIIADEPTGNLDTETESDILKILQSLAHDEGKCVIIVTHSKKVSGIADEVFIMKEGRLVSA